MNQRSEINHLLKSEINRSEMSPSQKFFLFDSISPFKMMKNAFYSMLKALFVLEMFKFLS